MVIQKYQISKEKKNDLFKKIKESQDKNSSTIKKFDDSIENVNIIINFLVEKNRIA